jgi:hypothetical protein
MTAENISLCEAFTDLYRRYVNTAYAFKWVESRHRVAEDSEWDSCIASVTMATKWIWAWVA